MESLGMFLCNLDPLELKQYKMNDLIDCVEARRAVYVHEVELYRKYLHRPTEKMEKWLADSQKLMDEARSLSRRMDSLRCFDIFHTFTLGRQADKLISVARDLLQERFPEGYFVPTLRRRIF